MNIKSKLPNVGNTIFSVMSALANKHGAINLAQGFPNFDCDDRLKALAQQYIAEGYNQYAPMPGLLRLREILSQKTNKLYQQNYSPDNEITITVGATQGIFTTIAAFIQPGDEVIIIEPAYDSYQPAVETMGAKVVPYEMKTPDWKIDWTSFAKLISPKTRMIIFNTPHNPTGTILQDEDIKALSKLVVDTDIILLSDEVYEHLVFDGEQHCSILAYPELRKHSIATFSFGKMLHATGWRTGYIIADESLMREFRKVHQFNVFSNNTPIQHAIADYIEDEEAYLGLSSFFQKKRDLFLDSIKDSPFQTTPSQGTYFQLVDYSEISDESDTDFAIRMTKEVGVAVIPISAFYGSRLDNKVVRFCFAKTDEVLLQAGELIRKI
ncbi:MAG: aminotransferase class I/II-fold pyridoxal phosphate-dependent enzyme [Aureispira sp.]|nr:aminotransferase class I/II-fold pyridoxal phosphate-dependent enzyme [Aureispira sp.]